MADVAFVPERDIFHRGDGVTADDASQTAQSFAGDRVALVRHGRAAFLALGEKFFHLEDLGALQMAELGGPAVERAGGQGEHGHEFRMAVALDDLGGKRGGLEPELGADFLFDARIEVGARADGTAQFSHGDALAHFHETFAHAAEFVIHQRHLETEGDRFGMDAVAAAHHGRESVRTGLLRGGSADFVDTFDQQIGGFGHLHRERGVEDIGRGQPLVHPTGGGTDRGGDIFEEGNDVVVGALFDLEDLGEGKFGFFADGLGVSGRDLSQPGHGLTGEGFDLEPDLVFALVGPEGAHLRPGITVNHRRRLTDRQPRTNPENKKGRKPLGPGPACHEKMRSFTRRLALS